MPCTVTPEEARYYEAEYNKKHYGVEWNNHELTTAVACWLSRQADLTNAPAWVKGWVANHAKQDEQRWIDAGKPNPSMHTAGTAGSV